MDPFLETYSKIIADWAKSEPLIIKAYIYGSRITGEYNEDSDLDVAIEIKQLPQDSDVLSTWINEANGLRSRLSIKLLELTFINLHLTHLHEENEPVWLGVKESGVLIYQK